MVKYYILSNKRSIYRHTIKRLGIYNNENIDPFIQDLSYDYNTKETYQSTMLITRKELEVLSNLKISKGE